MSEYRLTVGLEVHAELKTATKMFCGCRNDPDAAAPNANICPVCMAHPGTLPVINKEAVHKVLLVGTAVGGTLADFTEFDRKNYFYPDIPKGYQISQYQHPLVQGGMLAGVQLTRIHLEEDTARSQHTLGRGTGSGDKSLVDYNRAGVPLMELVTEPVITSAEQASMFAKELQLLLRYLGAGDANMENGEMRVEANISVAPKESDSRGSRTPSNKLGTKVEVKNLNSFRSVERAIAFEYKRQSELLDSGGTVVQETRGWDEVAQKTFSQRKKESSHDYRYFPDPDLPKLALSEIEEFKNIQLPELPWQRRDRYIKLGLKPEEAEVFVGDEEESLSNILFGAVVQEGNSDKELLRLAANYVLSDLRSLIAQNPQLAHNLTSKGFILLMQMIKESKVSSRGAKDILSEMYMHGGEPAAIAQEKGLMQQSDAGALEAIAVKIVGEHPGPAADFKAGKEAALQFLVGQGMRASKGSANPQALREAIQKILG